MYRSRSFTTRLLHAMLNGLLMISIVAAFIGVVSLFAFFGFLIWDELGALTGGILGFVFAATVSVQLVD